MRLGEWQWLRWVRANAGTSNAHVSLGIGDDAAVIDIGAGYEAVVTTDFLLENVHFVRRYDAAPFCGYRAASRALSDLAAMGAQPLALFLSCAFPQSLPDAWARGFYRGFLQSAKEAGASLAGGDTSASPAGVIVDVVGFGRVKRHIALQRSGAHAGDRVFVTGQLGAAALGREVVHAGGRPVTLAERLAVARHRRPKARWQLGQQLVGVASSAIDISDGLSTDLTHICEQSGCGAEIELARLPLVESPDALELALDGGEDYELLFTAPPRRLRNVQKLSAAEVEIHEIGRITRDPGVWLVSPDGKRERVVPRGWEHFSRQRQ